MIKKFILINLILILLISCSSNNNDDIDVSEEIKTSMIINENAIYEIENFYTNILKNYCPII